MKTFNKRYKYQGGCKHRLGTKCAGCQREYVWTRQYLDRKKAEAAAAKLQLDGHAYLPQAEW